MLSIRWEGETTHIASQCGEVLYTCYKTAVFNHSFAVEWPTCHIVVNVTISQSPHTHTHPMTEWVIHKYLQTSMCTGTHTDTHRDRHTVIVPCYNSQWHINTHTRRHVRLVLCCPPYLSVTHRHTHRHVRIVLCCPPYLSVTKTDTHTDMSD